MGQLGLEKSGFEGVPFVWARIEHRRHSAAMATKIFRRYRIQTVPGIAFGNAGEGFLRFTTTVSVADCKEAQERVQRKQRLLRREPKK